jgi:hypothetical protein
MDETRIHIAALWVSLMLIYLLGDVIRIFSGDFTPGEIEGQQAGQWAYLGIAVLMLIPILMIYPSLAAPQSVARWLTIIVSAVFFLFNAAGVLSYPGWYDRFLIVVSLGFNILTIYVAWRWVPT